MPATPTSSPRRARRSFWLLLLAAVLAAGWLSRAIAADPGPFAGIQVAASGVVLVVALALAARVMVALDRAARRTRGAFEPPLGTKQNRRR